MKHIPLYYAFATIFLSASSNSLAQVNDLSALAQVDPNSFVKAIQEQLAAAGRYEGPQDGLLTKSVISAINRLCREVGTLDACQQGPVGSGSAAVVAALATLEPKQEASQDQPATIEQAAPADQPAVEMPAEPEPMMDAATVDTNTPELVTNGTFDNDLIGWNYVDGQLTTSWDDGRMMIERSGEGADGMPTQTLEVQANKQCRFTVDISGSTGAYAISNSDKQYLTLDLGPNSIEFLPSKSQIELSLWPYSGQTTVLFDNVSVTCQ